MVEPPRNALFGDWRDAPIAEDALATETPLGQLCLYCEKPIVEGDVGQMMPSWEVDEGPRPIHRACLLVWIVGPFPSDD